MSATMPMIGTSMTMSGMVMETTTAGMPDMSPGHTMDMQDMIMTFFTSTNTPLYAQNWSPNSTGQYAGACVFLIVLAVTFRLLLAVRCNMNLIAAGYIKRKNTTILLADSKNTAASPRNRRIRETWRVDEALTWALIDTTLAGVSYLLYVLKIRGIHALITVTDESRMIAVMTMNVGYFLSILAGTFLGSFAIGQWSGPAAH